LKFRTENPIKNAFNNLRQNAKRRGKQFDLTFEQFEAFCVKTEYMLGKGKTKDSFHIDRKEEHLGYTIGNIQVLTNTQNVKKSLEYRYNLKMEFTTKIVKQNPVSDVPF
jgi:hypothetical protein